METTPPPPESSNIIRPDLLIRAKSGSITESITDAFHSFPAWFGRPQASPGLSSTDPSLALSEMISKITLKDIQGAKQCGGGGFGTVRILEHPTEGRVALKLLHISGGQRAGDLRRRTLREGETWQDLKHPHVLPFLGILETPTELYLVSPFAKNGALGDFIRQNPDVHRQKFLWKTASAIAYLHEHGIIHGDIKAANILVSDDVEPLLCDFGLAKSDDGATSVGLQGVGTVRFQSPEVLTEGCGKSFASDVWAFGMTIFEVLSGKLPFHQYMITTAIISAIALWDERPPTLPSHSPTGRSYHRLWSVAQACWQKDPALRPTIQDIHHRLHPDGITLVGHGARIACLAISPDSTTIVSGSWSGLRLWDMVAGTQKGQPLKGHTGEINCVAISPDGSTIVSGSKDCTLRLWDLASGEQRGEPLRGHTGTITSLAISPDGLTIVSGCGTGLGPGSVSTSGGRSIQLWDMASGTLRRRCRGHTGAITCLAVSPDGATIVSASEDYSLRLWNMVSGRQRGEPMRGHTGQITCLAISPDGSTIVSGSSSAFGDRDYSLRLWDMASGSQRGKSLMGHTGHITCLAISPDGSTIVSGSGYKDRSLRLWDMASGNQRGQPLMGHTADITCVAISSDGLTIVSGSDDRTIRIWDL